MKSSDSLVATHDLLPQRADFILSAASSRMFDKGFEIARQIFYAMVCYTDFLATTSSNTAKARVKLCSASDYDLLPSGPTEMTKYCATAYVT